jgi:hypothetical protein
VKAEIEKVARFAGFWQQVFLAIFRQAHIQPGIAILKSLTSFLDEPP